METFIPLTEDDTEKSDRIMREIDRALLDLGTLQEDYERAKENLKSRVQRLRNEHASFTATLSRHYLADKEGQWSFSTTKRGFARAPTQDAKNED